VTVLNNCNLRSRGINKLFGIWKEVVEIKLNLRN